MLMKKNMGRIASLAALIGSCAVPLATAEGLKIDTKADILNSARLLAADLMSLYNGDEPGGIPGLLPEDDYYFWESGVFMGSYIDYWHLTGNSTYNDVVKTGLLYQVGQNDNFMPANQSAQIANDDQCFWGLSAMTAAEDQFPDPAADEPQWLALAQSVFDNMSSRINDECNGGLRWGIFTFNSGYNYKNSISNGCLFNLGARLARYTGNATYAKTAVSLWDWLSNVGLLDEETWSVYDGASTENNCTDINKLQFSYNAAILAHGAAFMYNYTDGSEAWQKRVNSLTNSVLDTFFPDDIAYEISCEKQKTCTVDMITFKGLTQRWLAGVTQLAPFTASKILPILQKSAEAAVNQCTGGETGRQCGFYWKGGDFVEPKSSGVGEEMNVLAAVSNLLIAEAEPPATHSTSGSSGSDNSESDEGTEGDNSESGKGTESSSTSTSSPSQTSQPSATGRLGVFSPLLVVSMLVTFGWVSLM